MDNDDLAARIRRLECIVVRIVAAATIFLLVLGSFLTFYAEGDDSYSLVSTMAADEGDLAERVTRIGFIGLVCCTFAAVVVAAATMTPGGSRVTLRVGQVVFWLVAVGSLVPVLLSLASPASDGRPDSGASGGPAMWFYLGGLGLYGVLLFSALRNLWLSDESLHRPEGLH